MISDFQFGTDFCVGPRVKEILFSIKAVPYRSRQNYPIHTIRDMAPIQNQNPAFSGLIIMVVVLGGLLTLAILPFLLTAIYIYLEEIWFFMIRDPKYYREWNRGRKEWNKASAIERRHRYIMSGLLDRLVDKQGLSEADRFRYAALVTYLWVSSHHLILTFDL